jgi:hypothetical protein
LVGKLCVFLFLLCLRLAGIAKTCALKSIKIKIREIKEGLNRTVEAMNAARDRIETMSGVVPGDGSGRHDAGYSAADLSEAKSSYRRHYTALTELRQDMKELQARKKKVTRPPVQDLHSG